MMCRFPLFRIRLAPLLRALLVLCCAVAGGSCAVNPVTGHRELALMSEQDEIEMGREANPDILKQFGGAYDNPGLQAYVQRVGTRLASHSDRTDLVYHFTLLDSDEVNAFALPGGYVYITRGLLAYLNSEAELAAVLGHEIGHVNARHAVQRISATRAAQFGYTLGALFVPELRTHSAQSLFNVLGSAIISGYGRDQELQADKLGAEYIGRSGYAPGAMIEVIGVLKDQEEFERRLAEEQGRKPRVYHGVFASHPANDQRLQEVVASVGEKNLKVPASDNSDFLHRLAGLRIGPGSGEGVLRGDTFYHQGLKIAFDLPPGWQVDNMPDRLVAQTGGGEAMLQLTVEDQNKQIPPQEFMHQRLGLDELRDGAEIHPDGLDGYTAVAQTRTGVGPRWARFSVIYHGDRAFVFAGATKDENALDRYDARFLAAAHSFHRLTPEEAKLAQPLTLDLIRAREGVTFAALAQDSPIPSHAEAQLRLLNQIYPKGEPKPGQLVKVVK